jgi:hypothetical protein
MPPFFISTTNRKEIFMSNSQQDVSTPELIEQVIGFGPFSFDDESHFSWQCCEHCTGGMGAEVYDPRGYRSRENRELYEFQVCGECINSQYYGGN